MKAFASIALAAVAATSTIAAPAKAYTDCNRYGSSIVCVKPISGSVERVGVKSDNGSYFIGDITCTTGRWILHDGWDGTVSRSTAASYARAYCDGRGSMFVGA